MKIKPTKLIGLIALVLLLPLMSGCFKILLIDQPANVDPGAQVNITMQVRITTSNSAEEWGILALLIPTDWTVDLVQYTGDSLSSNLSFLHPDSADKKGKFWANNIEAQYPSDASMHWVVYQADDAYPPTVEDSSDFEVTVEATAGAAGTYNIGYLTTIAS